MRSDLSTGPAGDEPQRDDPYRLPRTVEPVAYRILLEPDLDSATFTGRVDVDVRVLETTDRLVLNAAELEITGATVVPAAGDPMPADVALDAASERVTLGLPAQLPAGDATVSLSFTGILNDQLRGFYRSTYTDDEGGTHTVATSHLEAADARRAFPCWDEPDRKATFEVTLVVDEGLAAFSNSPVVGEEPVDPGDGTRKRRVRFAPTMKMSTYLVAFVVGPMEATDPVDMGGVPVRIVHRPGRGHLTAFALDAARHALAFFTEYFAIPYPAQKLDLVAVPDFAYGAMENLGCVIFRETALLVDPATAAQVELERVSDVVQHEIAHMWFGDLVTMGWWEGIWLNEAFATLMETMATDHFRPEWEKWRSFALTRDGALAIDSLHATRPIEYPVRSPADAEGMIDALTYEKGGSVLRMLEQYLGPDVFRDGIRRYLREHAYANTETADLWRALEEVSGEPVGEIGASWILQGGHPIVHAGDTSLAQEPFSFLPRDAREESAIGHDWLVPLLVRTLDAPASRTRVLLGAAPAALPGGPGPSPVLVNAGGWGVYRVSYAPGRHDALASRLYDLDGLERLSMFTDAWALVRAQRAELGTLLALAAHLDAGDDELGIWRVLAAALALCERIASDEERATVHAAARGLLGPRAASLGWDAREGEPPRVPTLRALMVATLGTVGRTEAVRAEASRRFDASKGGTPIPGDMEAAILAVVADQDRPGDYEAVLDRYRHPRDPQFERRHLLALGAFGDPERCRQSFGLCLDEVRNQDGPMLVHALLANRRAAPVVWPLVEEHWGALLERFPETTHTIMLRSLSSACSDAALAERVTAWVTAHPLEVGQRTVAQQLELLEANVALGRHLREGGRLVHALAPLAAR